MKFYIRHFNLFHNNFRNIDHSSIIFYIILIMPEMYMFSNIALVNIDVYDSASFILTDILIIKRAAESKNKTIY